MRFQYGFVPMVLSRRRLLNVKHSSFLMFYLIFQEIVGGMIDAEPNLWRKPHKENFENQKQKVLQFEQNWRDFDWTQNA